MRAAGTVRPRHAVIPRRDDRPTPNAVTLTFISSNYQLGQRVKYSINTYIFAFPNTIEIEIL